MKQALDIIILGKPSWLTLIVWAGAFALFGLPILGLVLAAAHLLAFQLSDTYENWVLSVIAPYYGDDDVTS